MSRTEATARDVADWVQHALEHAAARELVYDGGPTHRLSDQADDPRLVSQSMTALHPRRDPDLAELLDEPTWFEMEVYTKEQGRIGRFMITVETTYSTTV